jgi:Skp family chaperone for outer membrane proteins
MFRAWAVVAFTVAAVLAAGCGNSSSKSQPAQAEGPTGGVGVVDLDVVAKRLGRDLEMNKSVQERLASLNAKLTTLQASLRRLYDEKKASFGNEPSEDQVKQLQTMQERMDAQLLESKRAAETELAGYKQALIEQFREQARPVLREVANSRHLSIVVPKNNALLLSVDPAVEITDDVAEKMQSLRPDSLDDAPQASAARPAAN